VCVRLTDSHGLECYVAGRKACCVALTAVCVQVAWQNGLMDLAMPFMIQFMKDYVGKVDTLMADRKDNMEAHKVSVCKFMRRAMDIADSLAAATETSWPAKPTCLFCFAMLCLHPLYLCDVISMTIWFWTIKESPDVEI